LQAEIEITTHIEENIMAKKVAEKKIANAEKEVGQFVSRSEKFIENNKKNISYGLITVLVLVGVIMAYHHFYKTPRANQAAVAIFRGEHYFQIDSFELALNGNGIDYDGFEYIIKHYGGTKTANLAKAYAGICYYKTGDMDMAIKHLKSFKSKDDNIAPTIIGLIGDCYVESGDIKQGITFFERAASKANNDFLSPVYLKKAGIAYEHLQQFDNAVKAYTVIKEKHAASMEAMDIEKYIIRAQHFANR
jgi:tetratricopeptide (TPR) repeat protein